MPAARARTARHASAMPPFSSASPIRLTCALGGRAASRVSRPFGRAASSTASASRSAPKRTGSSAGSPVSASAAAIAARAAASSSVARVERDRDDLRRPREQRRSRSCSSTSSASDGIGKRSSSSTNAWPAMWQSTNACGALPCSRPSVTPEYDGMEQRALALDPEQLAAARDALEHELLGGAGDEVGDDGVDGDPPAGDRDPGLAGRDELARDARAVAPRRRARARRSSSRSRSRSRP